MIWSVGYFAVQYDGKRPTRHNVAGIILESKGLGIWFHTGQSIFNVTHILTGKRILGAMPSLPQAVAFAESISDLTDWGQKDPRIPFLSASVKAAWDKCQKYHMTNSGLG